MNFKSGNIIVLKPGLHNSVVICQNYKTLKENLLGIISSNEKNITIKEKQLERKTKPERRKVHKNEIGFIVSVPAQPNTALGWMAEACFPNSGIQGIIDTTDFILLTEDASFPSP